MHLKMSILGGIIGEFFIDIHTYLENKEIASFFLKNFSAKGAGFR